jgi:hypothetical protein
MLPNAFYFMRIFQMKIAISCFFIAISLFFACKEISVHQETVTENSIVKTDSIVRTRNFRIGNTNYRSFILTDYRPHLTDKRPNINDSSIVLSIACAFTLLENDAIDGMFIDRGKNHCKTLNNSLGGLLIIDSVGKTIICKRDSFALNNTDTLTKLLRDSVSLCQQIQLVRYGKALRFGKDKALFQRRALVVFKDNSIAVIESESAILLQTFADDLATMGAQDALYTDMGGWDEGWVRSIRGTKPTVIGLMRSQTHRQSNWLYFTY